MGKFWGGVSELVDEHDLGSCAERRPGSSPGFPTNNDQHSFLCKVDIKIEPHFPMPVPYCTC